MWLVNWGYKACKTLKNYIRLNKQLKTVKNQQKQLIFKYKMVRNNRFLNTLE